MVLCTVWSYPFRAHWKHTLWCYAQCSHILLGPTGNIHYGVMQCSHILLRPTGNIHCGVMQCGNIHLGPTGNIHCGVMHSVAICF